MHYFYTSIKTHWGHLNRHQGPPPWSDPSLTSPSVTHSEIFLFKWSVQMHQYNHKGDPTSHTKSRITASSKSLQRNSFAHWEKHFAWYLSNNILEQKKECDIYSINYKCNFFFAKFSSSNNDYLKSLTLFGTTKQSIKKLLYSVLS